jgi:hypothetical protein
MNYLIGKLMRLQAQRDLYDRVLRPAPGLDLARPGSAELARFLEQRTVDPLTELLRSTVAPSSSELAIVRTLGSALLRDSPAQAALDRYPLNSPKMLGAAKDHGIDERILIEIQDQLDEGR